MSDKVCAILAEAPELFPWGYDEEDERCGLLKILLMQQIGGLQSEGFKKFHIPINAGFGLYTAETILGLKEHNPGLELVCYIPHEEFSTKWTPDLRDRVFNVLGQSDDVHTYCMEFTQTSEIENYMTAADEAETILVLASAPTPKDERVAACLHYAKAMKKQVVRLYV